MLPRVPCRALVLLAALVALAAAGCGRGEDAFPAARTPDAGPWDERLLKIAASFRGLGIVDDGGRWAPWDCIAPSVPRARATASADAATHGGDKVYAVFAKDPEPYRALTGLEASRARRTPMDVPGTDGCSQVLVKEAFRPVEAPAAEVSLAEETKAAVAHDLDPSLPDDPMKRLLPVEKDGKRYAPGERLGLFVMFRLDPATPGTDDGWVYGTVTADGKSVTSAGRVASCMRCHEAAPHGRLFGLPR